MAWGKDKRTLGELERLMMEHDKVLGHPFTSRREDYPTIRAPRQDPDDLFSKLLLSTLGTRQAAGYAEEHYKNGRLHSETGPARVHRDGREEYYIDGIQVTRECAISPETMNPLDIVKEANAEKARVMMTRYGFERFVLDSDAKEINSYVDPRDLPVTLYHLRTATQHIAALHMFNATLEPDGSRKPYILRVPPSKEEALKSAKVPRTIDLYANAHYIDLVAGRREPSSQQERDWIVALYYDPLSAKSAMAWTFGLTAQEYAPLVEA